MKTESTPIVETVLSLVHPELAVDEMGRPVNPAFREGLKEFGRTLPAPVQKSLAAGDYQTVDWAIRQYKKHLAIGASKDTDTHEQALQNRMPYTESASGGGFKGGPRVWTRAEIRELMKKPDEYAKFADEIGKAYDENRVK